ncbi:hypothetical protein WKI45_28800 [Delftia tsuruhatensis]
MTITLEAIRTAGGIVHSDGNIFFRDISMLQGLAGAAPAAVAGPAREEIAALRAEHGITSTGRGIKEFEQVEAFVRAVLQRWGAAPALEAPAAETIAQAITDNFRDAGWSMPSIDAARVLEAVKSALGPAAAPQEPAAPTEPGRLDDGMQIRCRKCGEQATVAFNSARIVTHNKHTGKPRDERDIASDPEGRLIVAPGPLHATSPEAPAAPGAVLGIPSGATSLGTYRNVDDGATYTWGMCDDGYFRLDQFGWATWPTQEGFSRALMMAATPQAPAGLDELGKIAAIAACWGCDHPDDAGDTELLRRVKWASRQLRAAQAPAAPSADALEVIENLLQLARIVDRAVEDWGESFADGSCEVCFYKEEADKLEAILEFFDGLPDAPAEEGVIESGPLRAARVLRAMAAPAAPAVDAQAERDAAFEAVRNRLCGLQRYSFVLDDDGVVRRAHDRTGNWIEFDAAHELFDPVAVDAAQAAAKGEHDHG